MRRPVIRARPDLMATAVQIQLSLDARGAISATQGTRQVDQGQQRRSQDAAAPGRAVEGVSTPNLRRDFVG
ncbi:MAG: hypothetical protein ABI598_01010 [Chloroflexota bacterium]